MANYGYKLYDFLIIAQEGVFSLLLYDREVERADKEEELHERFGKLHWELPPDISRYVEYLSEDQRKMFLQPHAVILRQIQWLLLASMDGVRHGNPLRDFALNVLEELSRNLYNFDQEATKKQEQFTQEKSEDA